MREWAGADLNWWVHVVIFLIITKFMPQRKKNQNKENVRVPKKPNIQYFNYTQELRMPTQAANEMRQGGRSIQLVKSNHKKPASRKTRCVSVKPSICPNLKFKQMMRQIKSMKLMQSKEKSPSSSKLKTKNGKSNHKITQGQLNTNANSEMNLTAKLQKTLKKLNQTDYFRDDEDSLIPLVSSSDAFTYAEKQNLNLLVSEHCQDINIKEMRAFCMNSQSVYKKSVQFLKGNIYEIMARRIQRAWRNYRTRKLVNRYVHLQVEFTPSKSSALGNVEPQNESFVKSKSEKHDDIVIESEELYPKELNQRKITYISNLDPEDENAEGQEEQLKAIKEEQLKKWSEIVHLIRNTNNDNPAQMEELLKRLISQSEINKKNLQQRQLFQPKEESDLSRDPQEEQSQKHQEFNSKKYIEYLDSDMYPIEPNLIPQTISKSKQEQLLKKLYQPKYRGSLKYGVAQNEDNQPFEARLIEFNRQLNEESKLSYRSLQSISESTVNLGEMIEVERQRPRELNEPGNRVRHSIKSILRCNSQKIIPKYQLPQEGKIYERQEQEPILIAQKADHERSINPLTETLEKQFQEDLFEPEIQRKSIHLESISDEQNDENNFDKLYTEEQLSKKLAELKKLKDEDSDDEYGEVFSNEKHQPNQNSSSEEPVLQRTTDNFQKINIEDYDRNIDSDEEDATDLAEKAQNISNMVFNSLIFDILKEMVRYTDTILKKFKQFSIKKPKIKRAQPKPKKNGFPTNQAEIKLFVNELCQYLLHEEPHVFKNLERATGPSAIEMLRYMHQSSDEQIYLEDEDDDPSIMVMPNWVFDTYWQRKSYTLKYERHGIDQEREQQRQEYLKSLNKIFYRSLFDCLNECLDFERNFGPFGKPFPWKRAPVFNHIMSLQETKKSMENSQKRLLQITSTYCGIIIEKDEMVSICGNQEYLQQVQEDRLSRMLAQDLVQGQQRWIFYDDEETELLVETSNIIFNDLLVQIVQECYYMELRQVRPE